VLGSQNTVTPGDEQTSGGVGTLVPTAVAGLDSEGLTVLMLSDSQVVLGWQTASEIGVLGFRVLRRPAGSERFEPVSDLIPAVFSGSDRGTAYTFLDEGLAPGAYEYTLELLLLDGQARPADSVEVSVGRALGGKPFKTP
jgi:hypothetical protein